MFFGRTDAKAETPVLWPPHVKSWLTGKDSDAGRDWGQEEKGTTEDEMAGWHHWLDGCESGWTPGVVLDREAWRAAIHGVTESDTTERLNWTELIYILNTFKLNWLYRKYIFNSIHKLCRWLGIYGGADTAWRENEKRWSWSHYLNTVSSTSRMQVSWARLPFS